MMGGPPWFRTRSEVAAAKLPHLGEEAATPVPWARSARQALQQAQAEAERQRQHREEGEASR